MEKGKAPVFWPGEFHRLCSPWVFEESGMTEWLSLSLSTEYGHSQKDRVAFRYEVVSVYRLMSGRSIPDILEKG